MMDLIANFFTSFVAEFYAIRNLGDLGIWLLNVFIALVFILYFVLKIGILEVNLKKFLLAGCALGVMAALVSALGVYSSDRGAPFVFFAFIWLIGVPFRAYKKDKAED